MNDNGDEFDSGPFCRHWGDPADCDHECANCRHPCCHHYQTDDGECHIDGCACAKFADAEESTK